MKVIFLLFLFSGFLLSSCKKIQPKLEDSYSGCECANEVSAVFLIEEMSIENTSDALYTETDSSYTNKTVKFTAIEENAIYKWYIGSEVISTKSFIRLFDESLNGQTVQVSLVVKKKPNSICFPDDDGYDSITKSVTFINKNYDHTFSSYYTVAQPVFEGNYRVKEVGAMDSVDFNIDFSPIAPMQQMSYSEGYILFNSNDDEAFNVFMNLERHWNYKQLYSQITYNNNQTLSNQFYNFSLKRNGKNVEVSLNKYTSNNGQIQDLVYKGRKIN